MKRDIVSWIIFQSSNSTNGLNNKDDNLLVEDADLSIESSVYIYQVLSTHTSASDRTKEGSVIVVIDEMYRPGKGVALKRNHYGIWRTNANVGSAAGILEYVDSVGSKQKLEYHDHDIVLKDVKKKGSLLVTNVEIWERRKDLTGIVLKTASTAVCYIQLNSHLICYKLLLI